MRLRFVICPPITPYSKRRLAGLSRGGGEPGALLLAPLEPVHVLVQRHDLTLYLLQRLHRQYPGTDRDLYSVRFFVDGNIGILVGDELTLLQCSDGGSCWGAATIK